MKERGREPAKEIVVVLSSVSTKSIKGESLGWRCGLVEILIIKINLIMISSIRAII